MPVAENLVGGLKMWLAEKLRLHEMIKIHPPFSIRRFGDLAVDSPAGRGKGRGRGRAGNLYVSRRKKSFC